LSTGIGRPISGSTQRGAASSNAALVGKRIDCRVANRPISDPVVDGVRGGVRYIGIEAAVPVSLIQEELAQARDGGGGVSMSTPRWGRIDETDTNAGGGLA